ncbi:MAG: BrnT family toxin, partial [Defluviitaleaceae bacterium]|nr:BrnT family toxin [Defluviitaleaceae bacterium]
MYAIFIFSCRQARKLPTGRKTSERDVAYELDGQLFVWDKIKAKSNKAKHGISFEEAASVFVIGGAEEFDDDDHSDDEER